MLTEICAEIKNYFTLDCDRHVGRFSIVNGQIVPSIDIPTDYIRIVGSRKNDGVHKRGEDGFELEDETYFRGGVWVMSPPKEFLVLADEIALWQEKNGSADSQAMSPFQSESFFGYSYSKASGGPANESGSSTPTWKSQYASRLNIYRKVREL